MNQHGNTAWARSEKPMAKRSRARVLRGAHRIGRVPAQAGEEAAHDHKLTARGRVTRVQHRDEPVFGPWGAGA
uniref:Uncharacterized protein n=1 Tax=Oryza meridionalis TaxID=40149 RepID=A0A0E0CXI9_9ORYZ